MCARNSFELSGSGILGSGEAVRALEHADKANALVVSDSHGNSSRLKSILCQFGQDSDALIFCGDGIRDMSAIIGAAAEDGALAACIPPVIALVSGNNDFGRFAILNAAGKNAADSPCYTEIEVPSSLCMNFCGMNVFVSHGHHYGVYSGLSALCQAASAQGASLALYGHTHVASASAVDGVYAVNPGSCALPRMGQPAGFARLFFSRKMEIPFCTFFKFHGGTSVPYRPPMPL